MYNESLAIKRCTNQYTLKLLKHPESLKEAYKLRYKIVVEELHWLPENEEGLEYDSYENHSLHIGLFINGNDLVGYVRAIIGDGINQFMLGREFKYFIKSGNEINANLLKNQGKNVEITRLVLLQQYRGERESTNFLYKGLVHFLYPLGKIYWYMIISPSLFYSFQNQGFITSVLEKFVDNSSEYFVILLNLEKTKVNIMKNYPMMYNLFFTQ